MSTALYRRYRSRRFAELVGQDVIATTLRNEVVHDALAHAYLFTGIRGTGKTSTARILARALNCLAPQDGEPCNECSACREILDGSSVDVLEIDAASNRGIDEMRDLREKVKYLPASLRRKVYIIDEAHMLTTDAWNAFLKTLEEPPPHVLFVLATTEPHKVPETVRSRVQRFDFRRVSTDDITSHLQRIVDQEGATADADALALLARVAEGSVRDALSMLDQSLAGGERPLTAAIVRRALGVADPATMELLLEALAGADGAQALRAVASAFDAGGDPGQLLREVARFARAAEFVALGHRAGTDIAPEERELAAMLARVAPQAFWLHALQVVQETERQLREPVDARLQVEYCVMRLVRDGSGRGSRIDALEARLARLEAAGDAAPPPRSSGSTVTTPVQPATPAPGPVDQPPEVAPSALETADRTGTAAVDDPAGEDASTEPDDGHFASVASWQHHWSALLEAANRRDRALAGVLRDCRAVAADASSLTVGTPYNFHLEKLRERARLAALVEAATEVAGSPRTVETVYVGEPAAAAVRRPGTTAAATQAVLDAFAGSRVTSTRLRDDAGRPGRGGPA